MNKIYERSEDLHVRAVVVYAAPAKPDGNAAEPTVIAYKDAELTTPVNAKELENAFIKGCVVICVGSNDDEENRPYLKPVMFHYVDNGVGVLGCYTYTGPLKVHSGELLG